MRKTNRLMAFVLAVSMTVSSVNVSAAGKVQTSGDMVFHVDVGGNDAKGNGSAENPFQSIERARDEVRKYNDDMKGHIL